MSTHHLPALQGSLFDQDEELRLGPLDGVRRTELGRGAWIDLLPGWLHGSDALFDHLAAEVPWRAEPQLVVLVEERALERREVVRAHGDQRTP